MRNKILYTFEPEETKTKRISCKEDIDALERVLMLII